MLVLILFKEEDQPGLRPVNNFRPMPIWIWDEHKQYKKANVKNENNTY